MSVNGRVYDWESIQANLPYGPVVAATSIEYSAELEKNLVYGRGSSPRGYGQGKSKTEGKMSLAREEFDRLVEHARSQGVPILKLPPFPITISYAMAGERTKTDVLRQVVLTKIGNQGSEGDSELKVDIDYLVVGGIAYDGVEAY